MKQRHRSWRRQLAAGHRGRQEIAVRQMESTRMIRGLEVSRVPGLFQTPEYARTIFDANASFRGIPPTTEAAVEARMRRQEALYEPGKQFRFLLCEAALYHRSCAADVMAEQLDRLYNLVGQRRVELGVLPFGPHGTPCVLDLRRAARHRGDDQRRALADGYRGRAAVRAGLGMARRVRRVRSSGAPSHRPGAGLARPRLSKRQQTPSGRSQSRAIVGLPGNRSPYGPGHDPTTRLSAGIRKR